MSTSQVPNTPDVEDINDVINSIVNNKASVTDQIRLIDEVRKAGPALQDRFIYRVAVFIFGIATLLTIIFSFAIALWGKGVEIPDALIAIGSASVGGLAGMVVPRSDAQ